MTCAGGVEALAGLRSCVLRHTRLASALRWRDWGGPCGGGCPPDTGYGVMHEAAPDQRSSHRRAAMKNYAGLDVSLEETAIAIVDETGRRVREVKIASEIEAIDAWLGKTGIAIVRLGLEAGPLSSWLYAGLKERGWPSICIETRRCLALTRAIPVKSHPKDAPSITPGMGTRRDPSMQSQ